MIVIWIGLLMLAYEVSKMVVNFDATAMLWQLHPSKISVHISGDLPLYDQFTMCNRNNTKQNLTKRKKL